MSPDNWKKNPYVQRPVTVSAGLSASLPHVAPYLVEPDSDFRGLTLFIGDTAEFVVGLRRFSDDGSPEVMWSSGYSVVEALINLDRAVSSGKWREDKSAKR